MTGYLLGIDGGGTKTHAAIMDDSGRLLGNGHGGPSNYDHIGVDAARANIATAVRAALADAGLPEGSFAAAFLGMAGVVSPQDRAAIHGIADDLRLAAPERVGVDHDCRIALAGGLSGRPGIVQIAGTGSSCFGMNAAGEAWRAGGWGHLMADEGGSYWYGIRALQAAVRAADGRGPATELLPRIHERLGLGDINDIMHRVYVVGMSNAEIAALAPLVIAAARAGDDLALGLVREGMEELALCIQAVARRLGMDQGPCELALVGGLFQADDVVLPPLREILAATLPYCRMTLAELPPVHGACLLAREILRA